MRSYRMSLLVVLSVLAAGCSGLDNMNLRSRASNPNRIYMSGESIRDVARNELDRYVCMTGPMPCRSVIGNRLSCDCH